MGSAQVNQAKMQNCPFCNKEIIEKQKVCETKTEYVFYNIRPANKGQCLVVPKRHVENITELDDEETASLFKTVKNISLRLKEYLKPTGLNYGFNEGEYAGQSVKHFHFHILPRFKKDHVPEFHLFHRHPDDKKDLSDDELKSFTEEFKKIFN